MVEITPRYPGTVTGSISNVAFEVRDGAILNTPKLVQIDRSSLAVIGAGNTFPVGQLETLTASFVQIGRAAVSFNSVHDLRGSTFDGNGLAVEG